MFMESLSWSQNISNCHSIAPEWRFIELILFSYFEGESFFFFEILSFLVGGGQEAKVSYRISPLA